MIMLYYWNSGVSGLFFFFFFQAEDGIRDLTVTGVQTCDLPICRPTQESGHADVYDSSRTTDGNQGSYWRSEERRVGKSVDLGGRRIIKKKKKQKDKRQK